MIFHDEIFRFFFAVGRKSESNENKVSLSFLFFVERVLFSDVMMDDDRIEISFLIFLIMIIFTILVVITRKNF